MSVAVEQALAGGKTNVWVKTEAEAKLVQARLRLLLGPDPETGSPPLFHGPESHRGVGDAPDAVHFNAEGFYGTVFVEAHIYFNP